MKQKQYTPEELSTLTEIFRRYGADDPESWAKSQLQEGIPQLARFSFCKALWEGVVSETDNSWIEYFSGQGQGKTNTPCSQVGPALQEMLDRGVSREAIVDLVRVMQYELLFHVCSLLDGSHIVDLPVQNWQLYQTDDEGKPVAIIQGLHESILRMDPTGREMRPRPMEPEK